MEEDLELLLVSLVHVVDWQWHIDGRVVQLDVLWLQVGAAQGTEHSCHLQSKEVVLHSWLLLQRSVELHARDPLRVAAGVDNH